MSITSNSEKHSSLLVCLFAVTLPLVTRRAVAATTTRRPARRRRTQAERTAAMRARLLDATVTSKITPLSGGTRSLLEHEVDFHFRGGGLAAFVTEGLGLTGGPSVVLRRGTLAQKRQIEAAHRR